MLSTMVLSKTRKEKNCKKYYILVDGGSDLIVKITSNGDNMGKKCEFQLFEVIFDH